METERGARARQIALYEKNVIEFLKEAVSEGADKNIPPHLTKDEWEKQKDLGKASSYLTISLSTLAKINTDPSRKKPLTREWARLQRKEFIINLHNNSSPELRTKYPVRSLFVRKPVPLQLDTAQIAEQVVQGVNNRRQIAINTSLTLSQVASRAKILNRMGIDLPKTPPMFDELEEKVEKEEDYTKLQKILDDVSVNSLIYYLIDKKVRKNKTIAFLTNILESGDFHVRSRELKSIAEVIKSKEIPIRIVETGIQTKNGREYIQSYIVVFTKHKDPILDAVGESPDIFNRLSRNPVQVAYGPTLRIPPKTYEIMKGEKYKSVAAILWDHFRLRPSRQLGYNVLLKDCPVSILRAGSGHYFSTEHQVILVSFLGKRLREMGKIE